jgi:hypothetical protein
VESAQDQAETPQKEIRERGFTSSSLQTQNTVSVLKSHHTMKKSDKDTGYRYCDGSYSQDKNGVITLPAIFA